MALLLSVHCCYYSKVVAGSAALAVLHAAHLSVVLLNVVQRHVLVQHPVLVQRHVLVQHQHLNAAQLLAGLAATSLLITDFT